MDDVITCCAVAQSRVLRTAWVPYGNMKTLTPHSSETSGFITMKLCTLITMVRQTHSLSLVEIRPLGVAPRIREIYTSCDFSSCLFSCAPAQAQRIEIISRTMAQKTQFGVRKCPTSKYFSLYRRFGGHFAPKPTKFRPQLGNPSQKKSNNV